MSLKTYKFVQGEFRVTDEMKTDFNQEGFILVKGLFSNDEVKHIEKALLTGSFCDYTMGLIGGDVYHYHTKLMKKPAKIGGKHVWHQDYGYWYQNGNLFPNMITTFIAVDRCTRENSCLQILKGSNRCGRIEHLKVGGQVGGDIERVEEIAKVCQLECVEMDPGDDLFFHCNLLHCSEANTSAARRWAFLCAYNRVDNDPIMDHHHPRYTPLEKVPDSAILDCRDFTTMDGKWFFDPDVEKVLNVESRKLAPTEQ